MGVLDQVGSVGNTVNVYQSIMDCIDNLKSSALAVYNELYVYEMVVPEEGLEFGEWPEEVQYNPSQEAG